MKAYVYRAALYCADCAKEIQARLCVEAGASKQLMETGTDSESYPQGPYGQGGGEADTPQHCDACGVFLENPLTPDGGDYVREHAAEFDTKPDMSWAEIAAAARDGGKPVLADWIEFYLAPGM